MKKLTTLLTTILIFAASTAYSTTAMTTQTIACEVEGTEFTMAIPMPVEWDIETIKIMSEMICHSVQSSYKLEPYSDQIIEPVCDTDTNCVLWEEYSEYGIYRIFMAPDNMQNEDLEYTTLEVHCKMDTIPDRIKYVVLEEELTTVCQDYIVIYQNLLDETKKYGNIMTDFSLGYYELMYFNVNGLAPKDRTHNLSPSIGEFMELLKLHPQVTATGIFRNAEGASEVCKNDTTWNTKEECIQANTGVDLNEINSRRWNGAAPQWFNNFCRNANEVTSKGQLRCWWD